MLLLSITPPLKNKKLKGQVYLFEVQEFLNDQPFIHIEDPATISLCNGAIKEAQAPWGQMDASDGESWV